MIKMSEEYERKMAWSNQDNDSTKEYAHLLKIDMVMPADNNMQNKPTYTPKDSLKKTETFSRGSIMRTLRRPRKSTFISETAFMRRRQTKRTLKMFIVVVLVFAILQLPNQIIWLANISPEGGLLNMFYVLAHVSPVVNCWIYGALSKRFRKAYIKVIRTVILCQTTYNVTKSSVVTTVTNISRNTSFYDNKKQQEFLERRSIFTNMFEHHERNFDQFKHLYNLNEEETIDKPTIQTPKRRMTLANFLHALKSPTLSNLSLDKTNVANNGKHCNTNFPENTSNTNTDNSPKKTSSMITSNNSCSSNLPTPTTSRKPSFPSIKPTRKLTLANIISAFKPSILQQRCCNSLPNLADNNDEMKTSSLSNKNINYSKSSENMNGSACSESSPLCISQKNKSSLTLTQANSNSLSELVSSCDDMFDDVVGKRENSTPETHSKHYCENITKLNYKEPLTYSKMKQKFKHTDRNAREKYNRSHTIGERTFENRFEQEIKEAKEKTSVHQQILRRQSLTDKPNTNFKVTEKRRASIDTIPGTQRMDINLPSISQSTNLYTCQEIKQDSREYCCGDQESIQSPFITSQRLKNVDYESQLSEPRKRKNASISLPKPTYSDDFERVVKYVGDIPTNICDEADKNLTGHITSNVVNIYDPTTMDTIINDISSTSTSEKINSPYQNNMTVTKLVIPSECLSEERFFYNNHNVDIQWGNSKYKEDSKCSERITNHVQKVYAGNECRDNTSDYIKSNITIPTNRSQKSTGRTCNTGRTYKTLRTYKNLPLISTCFSTSDSSVEDAVLVTKIENSPSFTRKTKLTDHVNSRLAEARKKDIPHL